MQTLPHNHRGLDINSVASTPAPEPAPIFIMPPSERIAIAKKLMLVNKAAQQTLEYYYEKHFPEDYELRLADTKKLAHVLEATQVELSKENAKIIRLVQMLADSESGERHDHGTPSGESMVRIGAVDKGLTVIYEQECPVRYPPAAGRKVYLSSDITYTIRNSDGDFHFTLTPLSTDEGIAALESFVDWKLGKELHLNPQ